MAEYRRQRFSNGQLVFVYLRDDPYQHKGDLAGIPGLSDTHHSPGIFYFTREIAQTSMAGSCHEHCRMSVSRLW